MMGGRKSKHRTGTLLLILTISGVTSGLGAPASGEGGVSGLYLLKNHYYGGGMTQGTQRWCLQVGGLTGK
jgi:hypothetical protein